MQHSFYLHYFFFKSYSHPIFVILMNFIECFHHLLPYFITFLISFLQYFLHLFVYLRFTYFKMKISVLYFTILIIVFQISFLFYPLILLPPFFQKVNFSILIVQIRYAFLISAINFRLFKVIICFLFFNLSFKLFFIHFLILYFILDFLNYQIINLIFHLITIIHQNALNLFVFNFLSYLINFLILQFFHLTPTRKI